MRPSLEARPLLRALLVVCFFICPLIFFTNLTRNPYVTQIALLNVSLLLAGAAFLLAGAQNGDLWPRTPLNAPLAAWSAVCLLSWSVAYFFHGSFFRPSIASEGSRSFLFLLANALCPFFLAARLCGSGQDSEVETAPWVLFTLIWGALWLLFPQARSPSGSAAVDIWGHVWDPYGALLWAAGLAAALWLCRKGRWGDLLHLALSAAFLASAYGVLQYFNLEFIWPQTLNPYGGRSVSTFGNPNFMSSYNVILIPVAAALFSRASGGRRAVYGALFLVLEAALLCSLTRSSWIGTAAGLTLLLLSPELRARAAEDPRPHGLLAAAGLLMALAWPSSTIVTGYTPSVIGRVSEVISAAGSHAVYGSFHQRLLIWTCGWSMGTENPLTGKGFGLFELFYPFYQGPMIDAFGLFRQLRTHANNGHNEIVEIWAQTGLLGLGVYAWLWTTFAASARRWWKPAAGGLIYAAFAAGAAGMMTDNLLNVSMHFAVPGFLFWWAVGTAVAPGACGRPLQSNSTALTWAARTAALLLTLLCWVWVCVWFREVHYFAGFKLLRQRALPTAVKELEVSEAWGPREVNAIYELGNAYAQEQRYDDALSAYHRALKANAGYDEIYYNIAAITASRLKRPRDAVDYFLVSHWVNPVSADVYTGLSNIYLADPSRYAAQAVALLEQSVKLLPNNAGNWNNLGYLYTLGRRWPEAERAYSQALSLDPDLQIAEKNLLSASQQGGRPRPKILEVVASLRSLESAVSRRDYSEKSLSLARKLDEDLPGNSKIHFFLGGLLLARGRAAEALDPLNWVLSRQPAHVAARINLGEAYLALGRRTEAGAQYRAVLAQEPGNAVALRRLSELGSR